MTDGVRGAQAPMRPAINSFGDLVTTALAEPDPCRLLTVLVRAETPYERRSDAAAPMVNEGSLMPVMARDWLVTPALTLDSVIETADDAVPSWHFIMAAIMPGRHGRAPTSSACDPHLKRMATALMIGASLADFVFFDRSGQPVRISNAVHGTA